MGSRLEGSHHTLSGSRSRSESLAPTSESGLRLQTITRPALAEPLLKCRTASSPVTISCDGAGERRRRDLVKNDGA